MRPGRYSAIFRRLAWVLIVAPLVAYLISAPARAEKRVALVIGNSTYRNVSKLVNPANDAKLVASTLRGLGFTLVGDGPQIDLDKAHFEAAVQTFGDKAQGADVGLFYYAGHGVQLRGKNFLAPIEANLAKEADVFTQMVDAEAVLSQMEGSGARLNLVILDACRNNPFGAGALRTIGGGLAQMDAPQGTLISYATQPGNVAQDGIDGDSPYTKALVQTVRKPGLGLFDVFNEVGVAVKRATGGAQQPWVASSPIEGGFYFVARTPANEATAALEGGKYEGLESPDRPDPALDKAAALSLHVAISALSATRDSQAPAAASAAADPKALAETPPDPEAAIGACNRFATVRLSPIRAGDPASAEFDRADAARAAATCRTALLAQPGKPRLMYALGRALMRTGGDEAEAIGLFQSAADAGYAAAMNSLGWAYANGTGAPRDPAEAVRWWRKGADAGNSDAMSRLAFAYERGVGVERDVPTAMDWWRRAAEAGDSFAMNRLGLAYANGFGFPKNPLEALAWFKKAAGAGETRAMNNVGMAYANGAGVGRDVVEAARWYRMAAEAGNPAGMNHLGYVYEQGLGVPRDPAEAVRWYQKAAEAGNVYAMNNLGLAYRNGMGVARNEEEAERWLRKARE